MRRTANVNVRLVHERSTNGRAPKASASSNCRAFSSIELEFCDGSYPEPCRWLDAAGARCGPQHFLLLVDSSECHQGTYVSGCVLHPKQAHPDWAVQSSGRSTPISWPFILRSISALTVIGVLVMFFGQSQFQGPPRMVGRPIARLRQTRCISTRRFDVVWHCLHPATRLDWLSAIPPPQNFETNCGVVRGEHLVPVEDEFSASGCLSALSAW